MSICISASIISSRLLICNTEVKIIYVAVHVCTSTPTLLVKYYCFQVRPCKCKHTASMISSLLNSEKSQQATLNVRIFDSFMKCVISAVTCTKDKTKKAFWVGVMRRFRVHLCSEVIIINRSFHYYYNRNIPVQSICSELEPIHGCFDGSCMFAPDLHVSAVKYAPLCSVITN